MSLIKGVDEAMKSVSNTPLIQKSPKDWIMWVRPEETRAKIDWDCPCLAGIRESPCGPKIIPAMDCFMEHSKDPVTCIKLVQDMQSCMKEHEDFYRDYL